MLLKGGSAEGGGFKKKGAGFSPAPGYCNYFFFGAAFFAAAFFGAAFFGAAFFTAFLGAAFFVAIVVILPFPHYETKLRKLHHKS
ncbi:MAG TPA: hypothetical protein VG273_00750 [Bryobacteraceae bacterium]|nr:hypothetical protein [Bryobacteraceae bacterium]